MNRNITIRDVPEEVKQEIIERYEFEKEWTGMANLFLWSGLERDEAADLCISMYFMKTTAPLWIKATQGLINRLEGWRKQNA